MYELWADTLLGCHAIFIVCVALGFIFIIVGGIRQWSWAANFWWRAAHLSATVFVAANAWFGKICPLTVWENRLRETAGGDGYPGSFLGYWLQKAVYHDWPLWAFAVAYTVFVILVLLTWVIWPPRWPRPHSGGAHGAK
jgi:hypothetical protein